jgi:hypothetical protein
MREDPGAITIVHTRNQLGSHQSEFRSSQTWVTLISLVRPFYCQHAYNSFAIYTEPFFFSCTVPQKAFCHEG